jgi:hypothetical protein
LEREYEHKEAEYDKALEDLGHLYEDRHDIYMDTVRECEEEFKRRKAAIQSDLAQIQSELDKIKRTRAAAMEAQLREQEVNEQATFYML